MEAISKVVKGFLVTFIWVMVLAAIVELTLQVDWRGKHFYLETLLVLFLTAVFVVGAGVATTFVIRPFGAKHRNT